jgi:MFS family permease
MDSTNYTEVFKISSFPSYLLARFFLHLAKSMKALVVSWQVYELTKDPLALGYLGLAEALPYLTVVLWAGHYVDQQEKRKIYLYAVSGQLLCSLALALLSVNPAPNILWIYLIIGASGIFISHETVFNVAYLQLVTPAGIYPRAVAWNVSSLQFSAIFGPMIAGFLLSRTSAACGYIVSTSLMGLTIVLAGRLKRLPPVQTKNKLPALANIIDGLQFIRSQPIIFAAMMVDMLGVLFGDVVAILPVFAQMLGVGAQGLGILRAAPAAGSLLMAQFQTFYPIFKTSWPTLLKAVALFGCAIICFAFSENVYLSVLFLGIGGMADNVSIIIRHSIYQTFTPDHLRGRVSSVSGIFIRASNEIGAFESGLAAKLLGTVPSVIFGGVMTLAVCALMKWKYPRLD